MPDCILMIAGQSNGGQMRNLPVAGCNPVAGAYVWDSTWRTMAASDGGGMIEIANDLRAGGFDNVYVYGCCYGGSSIVPVAAVPSANCWQVGDLPISDCLAQVAAGGKTPQIVIWIQGEQEGWYAPQHPSFDMVGNYKAYLDALRQFLLLHWNAPGCQWMVTPVGNIGNGDTSSVRLSQELYAASTPGVFLGPPRADLATLDGTHMTGPSCITFGDRIAATILAQEFVVVTDPQDKAAIASLQTVLVQLLQSLGSLQNRMAALEALNPALPKWPQTWN